MPYILLGTIALFILVARNNEKFHASVAAAITVLCPLILNVIFFWIAYGYEYMIQMTLSAGHLITLVLQYGVATVLFYKINQSEDHEDLAAFFGWVAVGWPTIFLLVPYLVTLAH